MFDLRDYQEAAMREIAEAWVRLNAQRLAPRILLVSRTGTGKTVIAGHFMSRVVAKGKRCIFAVRDRALIEQTSRHLDKIGVPHGVVAAGHRRVQASAPIQVCSIQTLVSRGESPEADVIIPDEAHGVVCATSRLVVDAHPRATILGLTATPERSDRSPLGGRDGIFQEMVVVRRSFEALVADGALVDFDLEAPPKPTKELSQDPIDVLHKHGRTTWADGRPRMRKTVFFARDKAHAKLLAEGARAAGFRCAAVDCDSMTSAVDLARLSLPDHDRDALDAIASVNMVKQGFDCPPIELLILATGFGSWGPWMQTLGRGLRPIPPELRGVFGKRRCLIFDLRGSVWLHGLPSEERPFSLTEGSRRDPSAPAIQQCKHCGAVFKPAPRCPRCKMAAPPQAAPIVRQKAMARVTSVDVATQSQKRDAFEALCATARERSYKPKWIGVQFQNRFGHWPKWPLPKVAEGKAA